MKKSSIFILFLMGSGEFFSCSFANPITISIEAGIASSKNSNSHYLSPIPGQINAYSSNGPTQNKPFVGGSIKGQWNHLVSAPFSFALGPSLQYLNLGKISGTQIPGVNIMPDGDPLNYSMKSQSAVLLLEPQIIFTTYRLQPYIFGGIGCAWNTLNNYTETTPPNSGAAPADNLYGSHIESSFASELGGGLQYLVWRGAGQENVALRAEYRYFNLGQARLGAAAAQIGSARMKANLTANVFDMGIAYHFK